VRARAREGKWWAREAGSWRMRGGWLLEARDLQTGKTGKGKRH